MTRGPANRKVFPKILAARYVALACAMLMTCMLSALHASAQNTGGPPPPAPAASPLGTVDITVPENVKAKSTLRGHVSYEGTGKPVRRARLILLARNNRGAEVTGITNARGEFQIKNVPEGKYFVMVDAPGIVTPLSLIDFERLNSDKIDYDEIAKQFEEVSVDGINDKEVEVRARRGGAISGRITYQDGDPAINVQVVIMRRRDGELKPFMTSLTPSAFFGNRTDDRGFYRFAGLPPGEYVLGATENIEHGDAHRNSDDFMSGAMFGGNSLVMTYYQDATSAHNATSIQIESGEEEKNVDITLAERALHVISGTVKARRDGRPLAHARVSLTNKENNSVLTQVMPFSEFLPNSETDEMGQWSFNEIPDGNYVVTVQPAYEAPETMSVTPVESQEAPARILSHNKKKFSQKQQDVKVAGHDVTNLVVEMAEGARISGTVTVEGGKPFPGSVFITAQPSGEDFGPVSPSVANSNGNFVVDGLPNGKLNLNVYMPDSKYYVKSIFSGGVDLLREPLLVQESADISGVRVVLSNESGTLTGHVLSALGGPPVSNARIVLYPTDPALWTRLGRVIFEGTDDTGAFSVGGAPGEYLFVVVRGGENAQVLSEEYVKARAATAPHVTLQANEQRSMEIIVPGAK